MGKSLNKLSNWNKQRILTSYTYPYCTVYINDQQRRQFLVGQVSHYYTTVAHNEAWNIIKIGASRFSIDLKGLTIKNEFQCPMRRHGRLNHALNTKQSTVHIVALFTLIIYRHSKFCSIFSIKLCVQLILIIICS